MSTTGAVMLAAALAVAVVFGLVRQRTDGRLKALSKPVDSTHLLARLGVVAEHHATFVQFSSEFCAPCRRTSQILEDLAAERGVGFVELDAAENLELVEEYGVSRTPTVILLDSDGNVAHKAVGVPHQRDLLQALDAMQDPTPAPARPKAR